MNAASLRPSIPNSSRCSIDSPTDVRLLSSVRSRFDDESPEEIKVSLGGAEESSFVQNLPSPCRARRRLGFSTSLGDEPWLDSPSKSQSPVRGRQPAAAPDLRRIVDEQRVEVQQLQEQLEEERHRHTLLEDDWRQHGEELLALVHSADLELVKRDAVLGERESRNAELSRRLSEQLEDLEVDKQDLSARKLLIAEKELKLQDREAALAKLELEAMINVGEVRELVRLAEIVKVVAPGQVLWRSGTRRSAPGVNSSDAFGGIPLFSPGTLDSGFEWDSANAARRALILSLGEAASPAAEASVRPQQRRSLSKSAGGLGKQATPPPPPLLRALAKSSASLGGKDGTQRAEARRSVATVLAEDFYRSCEAQIIEERSRREKESFEASLRKRLAAEGALEEGRGTASQEEEILLRAIRMPDLAPGLRIKAALALAHSLSRPGRDAGRAEFLELESELNRASERRLFTKEPFVAYELSQVVLEALGNAKLADAICTELAEEALRLPPNLQHPMSYILVDLAEWRKGRGELVLGKQLWDLACSMPQGARDPRTFARHYAWRFKHEPGVAGVHLPGFSKNRSDVAVMQPLLGPGRGCSCRANRA
ncbi:unnamed protein product, partial [Polarella glacialis]